MADDTAMNEQFAREIRIGLVELLDPERGSFPAWEGCPASARIRPPIRWWSGRRAVFAAALLAVLLVVSGLIVAGALRLFDEAPTLPPDSLDRHSRTLVPTGIITTTTAVVSSPSAIIDGSGDVWFFERGLLLQYEPASGAARAWTVEDDLAFASDAAYPARRGGVWLTSYERRTLTWFDGTRVRDEIAMPKESGWVSDIAEATDDVIWLAADGLFRWGGSSWTDGPAGRPVDGATALAIDGDGNLWTADADAGTSGGSPARVAGVSRYDGSAWTTYGPADLAALGSPIRSLEASPNGTIWGLTEDDRLVRFDGDAWAEFDSLAFGFTPSSFAIAGDDEVRVAAISCAGGRALVADFRAGSWQKGSLEFGPIGARCTWAVLARDTVFVVVGGRLDRFADGMLTAIWPGDGVSEGPVGATSVAAVSGREAWAYGRGLWHWLDDDWVPESPEAGLPGRLLGDVRLARAPGGQLWLMSENWVGVREDGRWRSVGTRGAGQVAFGPDGAVWIGPRREDLSTLLQVLRTVGGAWTVEPVPQPPLDVISSIAVTSDGTLWATANHGWVPTPRCLARYDGTAWESVSLFDAGRWCLATVAASPNGDLWALTVVEAAPGDPMPAQPGVWHYDDGTWTVHPEAALLIAGLGLFEVAGDGTVWAASLPGSGGLVRFDGTRWTIEYTGVEVGALSVAPDGSVWTANPQAILRLSDGTGQP